jgi:hypothetical protein
MSCVMTIFAYTHHCDVVTSRIVLLFAPFYVANLVSLLLWLSHVLGNIPFTF